MTPDFSQELELTLQWGGPVAGVDEVGRGPLAGPVLACAAMPDPRGFPPELAARVRDSKQLTAAARQGLFMPLRRHARCAFGAASVAEIAQLNILGATMLAMRRALARLPDRPAAALVDGNRDPQAGLPVRTVVGGDRRCLSIAVAAILAKVVRDRQMAALARRWPGYGWARNAGYGTAEHRRALQLLGPTPHHRRDFAPVAAEIARRAAAVGEG